MHACRPSWRRARSSRSATESSRRCSSRSCRAARGCRSTSSSPARSSPNGRVPSSSSIYVTRHRGSRCSSGRLFAVTLFRSEPEPRSSWSCRPTACRRRRGSSSTCGSAPRLSAEDGRRHPRRVHHPLVPRRVPAGPGDSQRHTKATSRRCACRVLPEDVAEAQALETELTAKLVEDSYIGRAGKAIVPGDGAARIHVGDGREPRHGVRSQGGRGLHAGRPLPRRSSDVGRRASAGGRSERPIQRHNTARRVRLHALRPRSTRRASVAVIAIKREIGGGWMWFLDRLSARARLARQLRRLSDRKSCSASMIPWRRSCNEAGLRIRAARPTRRADAAGRASCLPPPAVRRPPPASRPPEPPSSSTTRYTDARSRTRTAGSRTSSRTRRRPGSRRRLDYTSEVLGAIPDRDAIRARLDELFEIPSLESMSWNGDRLFFVRRDPENEQSVLYVQNGLEGDPRVLIDPDALGGDEEHRTRLVVPDERRRPTGVRYVGERQRVQHAPRSWTSRPANSGQTASRTPGRRASHG